MKIDELKQIVNNNRIQWHKHAFERMLERGIKRGDVKNVLLSGEIIEDYPEDNPYPSVLILGWIDNEPLHVVTALDVLNSNCYIITAYKPDLEHFEPDFKTRK